MTVGSWSKNVTGSTQGGWVEEYLAGFPLISTFGTLLQTMVFILPSNWFSGYITIWFNKGWIAA